MQKFVFVLVVCSALAGCALMGCRPAAASDGPASVLQGDWRGSEAGDRQTLTIQGVEYAFRWCPPGKFTMGSPEGEFDRDSDEKQHEVTLSKGFWMSETEVTQEMWEVVMGSNPSSFKGGKLPVENVSREDCQEFITKLNEMSRELCSRASGMNFGLPTEAQWEYACRAGTTTAFHFGDDWRGLEEYGWYSGHKDYDEWKDSKEYKDNIFSKWGKTTHPVGTKKPNAWGLYDMHGNVWEWCADWYDSSYYSKSPSADPLSPDTGTDRVLRGGSWSGYAGYCRSANRGGNEPSYRADYLGLRLSLVGDPGSK